MTTPKPARHVLEGNARGVTTDRLIAKIAPLLDQISTGPWISDRIENVGQNWMIANFGRDSAGAGHILTTYGVHASEVRLCPEADSTFCALARTLLPLLIEERRCK